MPIYEFSCEKCRRVYQFFFRSMTDRRRPKCPRCGVAGLKRRMSGFAVKTGKKRELPKGPAPDVDPVRLERALAKMEGEFDSLDEEDPKQLGRAMRRVLQETGTDLGPEMDTALRRLEAGEDPEKIEEEMGDVLDGLEGGGGDYEYDDGIYEP